MPEEGHFILSPLIAALRTGFHSMAEIMLDQLSKEEDLDGLLHEAVRMKPLSVANRPCVKTTGQHLERLVSTGSYPG
jgi:hypothetical protein